MTLLSSPGAQTLVGAADTDGACSLIELRLPKGRRFPAHRHSREGISIVLLTGSLAVDRQGGREVLPAGGVLRFAADVPCGLEALTDIHFLVVCVPAGLEGLAKALGNAEPFDPDDVAAVLSVAGVSFVPEMALGQPGLITGTLMSQ